MREAEYADAAVEVLDILNYTNESDVNKIPQSFIKFLTDIANKNYKVHFNHERANKWIKFKTTNKRTFSIYIYYLVEQRNRTKKI